VNLQQIERNDDDDRLRASAAGDPLDGELRDASPEGFGALTELSEAIALLADGEQRAGSARARRSRASE